MLSDQGELVEGLLDTLTQEAMIATNQWLHANASAEARPQKVSQGPANRDLEMLVPAFSQNGR
ncbi:MAG: hypothetical protein LH660_11585 [Phormidesmis sp. CAN_BIN36]|nr:hypothetical protein [Phormidesmis sp. CAN_BIN36]